MSEQRTYYFLSLSVLIFLASITAEAQILIIGDTSITRLDSLEYQTDDVVVTATRVEKKIIDIPYPVFRLKNTQYKFSKRISVDDVLENVPGLFLQSRYGNHDVRISIRGFGSRSNTGIRGVRILLDGIPESEPDGQTRIEAIDFNSIGSIELVKGNASSLYTNAPGGVINFINDIHFPYSFVTQFNEFGSFDLRRNGIKVGVRTDKYAFLNTYSYHNYKGFRPHSQDYWHIYNTVLDILPGDGTSLKVLGYFAKGVIYLPGSLNKAEFEEDPYQAAPNEVVRNSRRETTKGRLGLVFNTEFGENNNQEIEITGYGTIKYFERVAAEYRIMNRYGIGASFRYINRHQFGSLDNEFSVGGDVLYQTGPIEKYENISGNKGDILLTLTDETIGNSGFYFSDYLELFDKKLYLLLTGRYDNVYFDVKDQLLDARSAFRRFEAFTPKAALNYKLTPYLAVYTSYGLSFDSPAGNELGYLTNEQLLNPDLNEQDSKNFEIGIKGNLVDPYASFFGDILFELTLFNIRIESEIVPYEVFGEVYFRNAAVTTRRGIEAGLDVEVINGLRYQLSYTYSDFVYDSYEALSIDQNLNSTLDDFSGNIVPTVPEHNAFTSLSYAHPFTENITGFLKGSYRYVSGMYVDDANSDKTDAYSLLNAGIGADMVFGRFNLLLNAGVNNIADEVYVGFININSSNGRFYEAGEPFNYYCGINLGYAFN